MHPIRKKRLTIVLFLVAGLAIAVALTTYATGNAPHDVRIRAGGMVEAGSVQRAEDSLKVQFRVTDYSASVPVEYVGILPDLFAEGQGVVAMGRLNAEGMFVADQVLAKHDENYMPPEVAESLERAEKRKADAEKAAQSASY